MMDAVVYKMPNFLTYLKLKMCKPLHIIICGVFSKGQHGSKTRSVVGESMIKFKSWVKNSLC